MSDWKLLKKETIFESTYNHLERWTLQTSEGKEIEPVISLYPDAIFIFALDSEGRVLVLRQFFISQLERFYGLVAGAISEGEDPKDCAHRELKEETGCVAGRLTSLGSVSRSKWGTGKLYFFLAEEVEQVASQNLDESEDIDLEFVSVEEFLNILQEGKLHDAPAVACAYRALMHLGILQSNV